MPDNQPTAAQVRRARVAVMVSFLFSGLMTATFGSRLVLIRQSLGVSPAGMGLLLLVITVGSVATMPLMGHLIERFGEVRLIRVGSALAWLSVIAGAYCAGHGWAVAMIVPLFLQGAGLGSWDVAQNLAGSRVEQGLGRSIMPQFHASFSLATLLGAGIGWVFSHGGAPLIAHFGGVAIVGLVVGQYFIAWLPPPLKRVRATPSLASEPPVAPQVKQRSAWLEPRTLLIGVVMLSVSLTEGSANDWITSSIVQSFDTPETMGIACLGVFLAAMTTMRLLGTRLIDRLGRVLTLRLCALSAITGLLCFGFGPHLWLVMAGAGLWGLGAALGFPVGISAASDDPLRAARRTAVVSTIGYLAFLGGPPLLGMIAGQIGFRNALLFILIPAVVSLLLAGWTAPPRANDDGRDRVPA